MRLGPAIVGATAIAIGLIILVSKKAKAAPPELPEDFVPTYISGVRGFSTNEMIYRDTESRGTTGWKRYEIDVQNTGSVASECVAECYIRYRSNDTWSNWKISSSLHSRYAYDSDEYDLVSEKEVFRAVIQPGQIVTFIGYARFGRADLNLEIKFVGDPGESPILRDEWSGFA